MIFFFAGIFCFSRKNRNPIIEAVIDDDGGLKRFYQIAGILTDDFEVNFTNKEDDFDAISWSFSAPTFLPLLGQPSPFLNTLQEERRKQKPAIASKKRILFIVSEFT